MIIEGHGVCEIPYEIPNDEHKNKLTIVQRALIENDKPIRICHSPTGGGKTYSFVLAAKMGHSVLFVVPTQALAEDIFQMVKKDHKDLEGRVFKWDGTTLDEKHTRKENWNKVRANGGIVLTTPETLGSMLFGLGNFKATLPDLRDFVGLKKRPLHIVFDEIHIYQERALGFLKFWACYAAMRNEIKGEEGSLRMTVLSATMAGLVEVLFDLKGGTRSYFFNGDQEIHEPLDDEFNEESSEETSAGKQFWKGKIVLMKEKIVPRKEATRVLHGDVKLLAISSDDKYVKLVEYLKKAKENKTRVLMIYDSLRDFASQDSKNSFLDIALKEAGVSPSEVLAINGMDKHGKRAQGSLGLCSGLVAKDSHILVIGTSAVEAGVNIPKLQYAIVDFGMDPAAFLQRFGRTARGDIDGEVSVVFDKKLPYLSPAVDHFEWYLKQSANKTITVKDMFSVFLSNGVSGLRDINARNAARIGNSYIDLLGEKRHLFEYVNGALYLGTVPVKDWSGSLYKKVRVTFKKFESFAEKNDRFPEQYLSAAKNWVKELEKTLQDIRGFSPTVSISFNGEPPVVYTRIWCEHYLKTPDKIGEDGTWIYKDERDKCLLKKSAEAEIVALLPGPMDNFSGERSPIFKKSLATWERADFIDGLKTVMNKLVKNSSGSKEYKEFLVAAEEFVRATGVFPYGEPSPKVFLF